MHLSTIDASSEAPVPDAALLAAWVERGDEAAFARLVGRHLALVRGVAMRRLGDEQAAEDVTQTVFAIMARKAASLTTVRILAAWLHRVASAQSARAIRQLVRERRRRQSIMDHFDLTSAGRDPLTDALPLLDEALNGLPERDRNLLLLRYSEGMGFAEAAARLGRGEAALRQQASRAVNRLAAGLRRNGVPLPAAVVAAGLAAALGGGNSAGAAEVARAALAAAPSVTSSTLFLTSLFTMSTLKSTITTGAVSLILTGIPVAWQGWELNRLRRDADQQFDHGRAGASAAPGDDVSRRPNSATQTSRQVRSRDRGAAAPDMQAIGQAMEGAMQGLMSEAAERMAAIEARRVALALDLSPDTEAELRRRILALMTGELLRDDAADDDKSGGNFQQKTREVIAGFLRDTVTPQQLERWNTLRRQREETEMEKVAADAFHATARWVDLSPEQKDALFQKCSDQARELYATRWGNSIAAGAAISPRPPEPVESDAALLREVLTPAQLADWQSQSAAHRDFYDHLPRRILGRVFSTVSGADLATAIQREAIDHPDSNPPAPNAGTPR